jgi:hypothetical protein
MKSRAIAASDAILSGHLTSVGQRKLDIFVDLFADIVCNQSLEHRKKQI